MQERTINTIKKKYGDKAEERIKEIMDRNEVNKAKLSNKIREERINKN